MSSSTRSGPLESALAEARELIARRPRTAAELTSELTRRGHGARTVESVCRHLRESGRLDDEALASHYILTRSDRLGHGPLRLVRELVARGVPEELARRAWDRAVERGDLDADALLEREVRRRVSGAVVRPRDWRRVYNSLLRAGFGTDEIRSALEPLCGADLVEADAADGFHDDFL